jgi:hypothetical protein
MANTVQGERSPTSHLLLSRQDRSTDNGRCTHYKSLDLNQILSYSLDDWRSLRIAQYDDERLNPLSQSSNPETLCPLCLFLSQMVLHWQGRSMLLYHAPWNVVAFLALPWIRVQDLSGLRGPDWPMGCFGEVTSERSTSKCAIRSLESNSIDYSVVTNWLETCHRHHETTCEPLSANPSPSFRLIDCGTRRIVLSQDVSASIPHFIADIYGATRAENVAF